MSISHHQGAATGLAYLHPLVLEKLVRAQGRAKWKRGSREHVKNKRQVTAPSDPFVHGQEPVELLEHGEGQPARSSFSN